MSTTTANPRPIDLGAILESQQPEIDLRIRDFEAVTRRFLKAVSLYSSRAVEEISQRNSRHAAELKRIAEKKSQIDVETTACKVQEIKLMEVLEREQAERRDAEASVSELKRQFSAIKEKCASADVEIDQYRDEVQSLRREKHKDTSILDTHAHRTNPELKDCEAKLNCVLEGVGRDKLLFRFMHIDPADPRREFSIVIDLSSRLYKVPMTTPPIPTLPILVDQLNASRDIYLFIKNVRKAFNEIASQT